MLQPELKLRRDKIRALMALNGIDAALIACNVNIIYTFGEVVNGYIYIPLHSPARLFIKRPQHLKGEHIHPIRKPEEIIGLLEKHELPLPATLLLEGDELPYSFYNRLSAAFPNATIVNGSQLIKQARTTKTRVEQEMFRRAGKLHEKAYQNIPSLYKEGMTDLDFSIEVERLMRQAGSLGVFRISGEDMEIFMGNILAGDNAAAPSPYDFALGGKGLDPTLPVSVCGDPLKKGTTIMVDMGGNFNGYLSDMSRVYSIGKLPDQAYEAHNLCLSIQEELVEMMLPNTPCSALYQHAIKRVEEAGYSDYFMGIEQQAKFIGHGVGLEINEAPVLSEKSKDILEPGMVIALEPKIILPEIGAVGIENTWIITNEGAEKTTNAPEEIIDLTK